MPNNDPGWSWDRPSGRYRNTASGRYLSHRDVVTLRDRFTDARRQGTRDLFSRYLPPNAATDPMGWNIGVRYLREKGWQEVQRSMIAQYTFGRGGKNAMTGDDRVTLQRMLRNQKTYWDGFMGEALGGRLTRDAAANRATLYDDASTTFYETGREQAFGITLPGMPGDGQTPCLVKCRCSWSLVRRKKWTDATWKTNAGDICSGCLARAAQWAPYRTVHPEQVEAERLYAKATKAEPGVTRDLRTLESRIDGDLNRPFKLANGKTVYPLDSRLKTVDSTARKIATDASDNKVSAATAAADINDNLRYTYTLGEDAYGKGVDTVLNGLEEMGYERVAVKNFWAKDDGYTGVHGIYRTPDGQSFEVQFHTSRTLETKELISHPLYEKQRVEVKGSPAWKGYQDQMDTAWRVIRDDPPGLTGLT